MYRADVGPKARIRQQLIEENLLDAAVGLAANLFTTTGIPVAMANATVFDMSNPSAEKVF